MKPWKYCLYILFLDVDCSRSILGQSGHFPNRVLTTSKDPETVVSSWRHDWFIMDLGCQETFKSIQIKNSHNHENRNSAMKKLG